MHVKDAKVLIKEKKYKKAIEILDNLLSNDRENSEIWYLKGIAAVKLRSYDRAYEYFENAIKIRKKPEYYRMNGIAHFEVFEVENAIKNFKQAVAIDEKDVVSIFFISIGYLFLDDPQAEDYMRLAKKINSKKTKQLLKNFFTMFLKNDPRISDAQKRKMQEHISEIN